jgi:hypothetical protein
VSSGVVLRLSSAGFGFVGEHVTAKKRLHFKFEDVLEGKHAELKTGTAVEYEVRTSDETMDQEAFNIRIVSSSSGVAKPVSGGQGGWREREQQRNNQRAPSSGGGGGWREREQQRLSGSMSVSALKSVMRGGGAGGGGGGSENKLKSWAAGGGGEAAQKTNAELDHVGKQTQGSGETGNSLLGIIGLGAENSAQHTTAKSCDDYDHNPAGGIGFSREYQISRGRKLDNMAENSPTDSFSAAPPAPPAGGISAGGGAPRTSWSARRGKGGGGRSLADLAGGDASAARPTRGRSLAELAGDDGSSSAGPTAAARAGARW